MFWKISDGIKQLAENMVAHPEEWQQGQYHFANTVTRDIQIWTANGTAYIDINGNKCLTMAEKRHIAAAIKRTLALKLLRA